MHLVACPTPQEPLEHAPTTALLADLTEGERWEGFWSSDVYFVRCTRNGGGVEWFRLADDEVEKRVGGDPRDPRKKEATRVLPFPSRPRLQTRVVVAKGPDGRGMLVGMARRQGGVPTVRRAGE
jgi:hypothetical protein